MAKINMPKGSPTIDMTPMVDLAFLLVTFFMLSAKTRTNEPVEVKYSTSISDEEVPTKTLVMITVDKGGCVYLNPGPYEAREKILGNMLKKYGGKGLTKDQIEEFKKLTSFGCSMAELPAYLDMSVDERKKFQTKGVPSDTIAFANNELKDWLKYANNVILEEGRTLYQNALNDQKPSEPTPQPEDFKPKYVIKADASAAYVHAKKVVETCRDLKLNNINFVTSLEMKR